jgi:hypothetical protein
LLPVFFDDPCQMSFHLFFVVGEASPWAFLSEDTLMPTLLAMCSNFALAGEGLFVGKDFLPGLSVPFLLRVGSSLGEVVGERLGDEVLWLPGLAGPDMPSSEALRRSCCQLLAVALFVSVVGAPEMSVVSMALLSASSSIAVPSY